MNISCKLCGRATNDKTGICVLCTLDPDKNEARMKIIQKSKNEGDGGMTKTCHMKNCSNEETDSTGFCKRHLNKEQKRYKKANCEVNDCEKLIWRDRRCMVHYNEKHGINKQHKKTGPKPKKKDSHVTKIDNSQSVENMSADDLAGIVNQYAKNAIKKEVQPIIDEITNKLTKLESLFT